MTTFSVKKAKLYRSGVGWFNAESKCNTNIIYFPVADGTDFNDFLKTSIIKLEKGKVRNASFETRGVNYDLFQTSNVINGIISFLRGKSVELTFKGKSIKGKLMGYQLIDNNQTIAILTDEGKIINIKIIDINEITPLNYKVKSQINEFLNVAASETDIKSQTSIRIELTVSEENNVQVSFLNQIPAWKLTYRLLLTDNSAILETHAIIDNTTLIDWENCDLTLSTKIPISYKYDLSTPHIIDRPEIYREQTMEYVPPSAEPIARTRTKKMAMLEDMAYDEVEYMEKSISSVDEQAEVELGESVEYHIIEPVTIKKNESSIVPLNVSTIDNYSNLLYYNYNNHKIYPFRAITFENKLGYSLDMAPMAIVKSTELLGEAMLQRTSMNERALVSYSLERDILITQKINYKDELIRISIGDMYQYKHFKGYAIYNILIQNKLNEPQELIISINETEYTPKGSEFELVGSEYQITKHIDAKQKITYEFIFEKDYKQSYHLSNLSIKELNALLNSTTLSKQELDIIRALLNINEKLQKLHQKIKNKEMKWKNLKERRSQIISTLEVLDEKVENETRKKYIAEIEDIDTQIQVLVPEIEELKIQINQMELNQKNPGKYLKNKLK